VTEQERMEQFYEEHVGKAFPSFCSLFFNWQKSSDGGYADGVTRMLWAAWQGAQYGAVDGSGRALDSREFQVLQRWYDLLHTYEHQ